MNKELSVSKSAQFPCQTQIPGARNTCKGLIEAVSTCLLLHPSTQLQEI